MSVLQQSLIQNSHQKVEEFNRAQFGNLEEVGQTSKIASNCLSLHCLSVKRKFLGSFCAKVMSTQKETKPGCFCSKDCLDSEMLYTQWYTFTCTGGGWLYKAVLCYTGLYQAVLGSARLYWAAVDCTRQYQAVLGCIELYWAVLDCTGLHCAVLDCIGLYLTVLDCTGLYWTVVGCTGLYWALLGCTGLYWTVLGSTGLYWGVLGAVSSYFSVYSAIFSMVTLNEQTNNQVILEQACSSPVHNVHFEQYDGPVVKMALYPIQ